MQPIAKIKNYCYAPKLLLDNQQGISMLTPVKLKTENGF
jgi:hypothetical protein